MGTLDLDTWRGFERSAQKERSLWRGSCWNGGARDGVRRIHNTLVEDSPGCRAGGVGYFGNEGVNNERMVL